MNQMIIFEINPIFGGTIHINGIIVMLLENKLDVVRFTMDLSKNIFQEKLCFHDLN
jgi:hypothetical protein